MSAFILATAATSLCSAATLPVLLHDYAGFSHGALEEATAGASRILENAGIRIIWLSPVNSGQSEIQPNTRPLVLNLLSEAMGHRLKTGRDCYGLTFRTGEAGIIYIHASRVRELASRRASRHGVILSRVIAHEIGHVLLGSDAHRGFGVMRARWSNGDLVRLEQNRLNFTGEEMERMRAAAEARFTSSPNTGTNASALLRVTEP